MKYLITRLTPMSSFFKGWGSVFNIFGNYYGFNNFQFSEGADQKALESDWKITGDDIFGAIEKYSQQSKKLHVKSSKSNQRTNNRSR